MPIGVLGGDRGGGLAWYPRRLAHPWGVTGAERIGSEPWGGDPTALPLPGAALTVSHRAPAAPRGPLARLGSGLRAGPLTGLRAGPLTGRRPGLRALRWALAGVAVALAACSTDGAASAPVGEDAAADTSPSAGAPDAAATACHPQQRRPDGTCCAAGAFFDEASGACEPVGPPECADVVFAAPDQCHPRWCWDDRNADDQPCEPWTAGCEARGRSCTAEELAAGDGCRAGEWSAPGGGACVPVGYGPGLSLEQAPAPPGAAGLPPVPTLPPLATPRWCWDAPGGGTPCEPFAEGCLTTPRPCTPGELAVGGGCEAGAWPAPGHGGPCVPAGYGLGGAVEAPPRAPHVEAPLDELPPLETPRWCWDTDDGAGHACPPFAAGCDTSPRPCTRAELVGGLGCEAGSAPRSDDSAQCQPAGGPDHCPRGFRPAPAGGRGAGRLPPCQPDPADCGAAPYGDLAEGPTVLHVDASAAPGGDGSKAAPFRSLGEALDEAAAGWTVGIAAGTYQEALVLDEAVTLHGRCAALVTVQSADAPVIDVTAGTSAAAPARLEGLRLTGPTVGLWVEGGSVVAERLLVQATATAGIAVVGAGSTVELSRAVVSGTAPDPADQTSGRGIWVADGARLDLAEVTLSQNRDVGLHLVGAGTRATATGLLVAGTEPQTSDACCGWGIAAEEGATLTLVGARLTGSTDVGLLVSGMGTRVDATGIAVDDTRPNAADGSSGEGAWVELGAELHLTGARLTGNRELGLYAWGAGTRVRARGLLVDGTLPSGADEGRGGALLVEGGAEVSLTGARLSANRDVALLAVDGGTMVEAAGLLVDGTGPQHLDDGFGWGIAAEGGATVRVAGGRSSGNRGFGLVADGSGVDVSAWGLLVDGTLTESAGQSNGLGVGVSGAASVVLGGVRLSENALMGLSASGAGTFVRAMHLLVDHGLPDTSLGADGWGLWAEGGAHVELEAARMSGNREVGLYVRGAGTALSAASLIVDGTGPDVASSRAGMGILVELEAQVALVGAVLAGNRSFGLVAQGAGTEVTAAGLLVRDTLPQVADGDPGRGVQAAGAAKLSLTGARLTQNTAVGLAVGEPDTVVRGVGVTVDHTTASPLGAYGLGVLVIGDGLLELIAPLVAESRGSGVMVQQGRFTLDGGVVRDTGPSSYEAFTGEVLEYAEGVLAVESPLLSVTRSALVAHVRAGLLVSDCPDATIAHTVSTANTLGLVLDGGHAADVVTQANAIFGNSQQNAVTDLGLAVPPPPTVAGVPSPWTE